MPEITLAAESGRSAGSRPSSRLRAAGRIPGVIYGHGTDPVAVSVEGRALRTALTGDSGLNALLALEVDGTTHLTMAREIQRHPVRGTVIHVDFQIVRRDEIVSADVPLSLIGDAIEVRNNDGVVQQELHNIAVNATPGRIPSVIEVDVSRLTIGDAIRIGDLTLPEGVTTDLDPEEAIVVASASVLTAELEELEAEAAEAGAEAAAGAEGAEGEEAGAQQEAGGGGGDQAADSSEE
jgi:large subunit ribosomal protein L25